MYNSLFHSINSMFQRHKNKQLTVKCFVINWIEIEIRFEKCSVVTPNSSLPAVWNKNEAHFVPISFPEWQIIIETPFALKRNSFGKIKENP